MNSQKGVTLTSLVIYIIVVLIVLGILAVISGSFQGNLREIYAEGTNNAEIDKFNVYFLKEVKRQGNEISTISNNEIVFTTGNKYKFNSASQCVFLNDSIKIAENIEKCNFSTNIENERTVITVTIKAVNGEEKTIEYVLAKDIIIGNYEDESDYTTYTEYAIGTEVTIGETGENFYVIKDDGAELVLLAKYNIKADGEDWIQDTTGASGICVFSTAGGFTVGENLNNNSTVKADTTSAVYKASQYAENTIGNGAIGRLMTYEEAEPLSESEDEEILEILYGTYTDESCLKYWLGSAADTNYVWCVNGVSSMENFDTGYNSMLLSCDFDFALRYGVRPVVVISESSVTLVP